MATAKKLKSGSWRVQVFSHYEYVQNPDGSTKKKRIYESFTSNDPTKRGKREVERMASEWAADQKGQKRYDNINLYDAVGKYIEAKENVLSPSTIAGYKAMRKNYFNEIGAYNIRKIDSTIVQLWISDLSSELSPKSVRNIYCLLASTLNMFCPSVHLTVTLPAPRKPDLYTPNDNDIKRLLNHIKGTELEIAVLLASFGPMRRGEICALEDTDISGNKITVNKSMVLNADGIWQIKEPKTYSSYRTIEYPQFVIDRIQGISGRIIKATPNQITGRFQRAIKFSHLTHFRFHDLRHYAASIMHAIGIPDQYIMERGGWKTDNVMKSVYRDVIDLETVKQNKKINKYFQKYAT